LKLREQLKVSNSGSGREISREDLGTNYLKVVTDFSQQDLRQLKTRIAAALEMNRIQKQLRRPIGRLNE